MPIAQKNLDITIFKDTLDKKALFQINLGVVLPRLYLNEYNTFVNYKIIHFSLYWTGNIPGNFGRGHVGAERNTRHSKEERGRFQ
jgi:hypothetical protein